MARSPSPAACSRSIRTISLVVVLLATVGRVGSAEAQQNIDDVLSFLLTNRTIRTDEPTQDEQAAAATRDAISRFLLTELSTLPTLSSASGFTYRLDPNLGGVRRSSDSFGPFFVERSLTLGRLRPSFGISYQNAVFHQVDGRKLRDGTLVATAIRLRGETQPFDVETLALELRTQTTTLSGALGLTDRFDVNVAVPLVRLTLSGTRVDTLRGVSFPQAQANASASGLGDVLIRTKYNLVRRAGGGLGVGFDWKVPTGDAENLLGAGEAVARPRVLASFEGSRLGLHGDVGYAFGGLSRQLDYGTALTVAIHPRLTLVGELLGRRLATSGRLTEITAAHPRLVGVETIRLSAVRESTERVLAIAGAKWNVASSMLLSATLLRPLTEAGLTPEWIPSVAVEYSFDR